MSIYAISDLHLTNSSDKPMNIFGGNWENYWEKITNDWEEKVGDDDIVLIAGDISWAMSLEHAKADLDEISKLKGIKVIIRGNHDYWWSSYAKVKAILPKDFFAIQNNAVKIGKYIFCGTRGWLTTYEQKINDKNDDYKIYQREQIRLKMSLDSAKHMQTNNEEIIVLTHFPPFNAKFSDSPFTDIINQYGVRNVIYGHLHGDACRCELLVKKQGVNYFLTSCDQVNNKLILIKK